MILCVSRGEGDGGGWGPVVYTVRKTGGDT